MASADITVTHATVINRLLDAAASTYATTTTPIDGVPAGNSFTTINSNTDARINGKVGFTSTLTSTGGALRADTFLTNNRPLGEPNPYGGDTSGSVNFTVSGGSLSRPSRPIST